MTILRSALLGCALALLAATPAAAGTASLSLTFSTTGGRSAGPYEEYLLVYRAEPGEANRLTISADGSGKVRVSDSGAPLTPGDHCRSDAPNSVICPAWTVSVPQSVRSARLELGDVDDTLGVEGLEAIVLGGPGDDQLRATGAPVEVDGGPGADLMQGPLPSRLTYADRTGGVTVTQDGVANDGEPGEGDNAGPGFGQVTGGDGDDELHVDGPAGTGRLYGRGGHDRLFGSDFADSIEGGAGDDLLVGGGEDDLLHGGAGADVLRGGPGRDHLLGYGHDRPVDVSFDDRPGDGPPGEGDDAGSDMEMVGGTPYDDRLIGSDGDDYLYGHGGQNEIDGRGGADVLSGSGRIVGGAGPDSILAGEDPLQGFPTFIRGVASVAAADGERDEIACPPGSPGLIVDPFDALSDCAPMTVGPSPERFRVTRAGTVRLRVRCHPGADIPCAGRAYARRADDIRAAPVGRGRFALPPDGRSGVVQIRLTRAYLRRLARAGRLSVVFDLVTYRTAPAPSKRVNRTSSRTLLEPRSR